MTLIFGDKSFIFFKTGTNIGGNIQWSTVVTAMFIFSIIAGIGILLFLGI